MLEKIDRVTPVDVLMQSAPVIPVLVVEDAAHAVPLAQALVAGGMPVLEITLRSSAALEAIRRIAQEVPAAIVGAGTVLNPAQFAAAQLAGARFIIAPGTTEALYASAKDTGLPFIPAVATPSEIMRGLEHGFARFKFFPAESMGGIAALKSFGGPFPDARFCPTGGVTEANLASYAALPNVFAVGGSWLAPKDKVAGGDWAAITALAQRAVKAAQDAKRK
ncbi:bifunctional 4-hydroxy-2-oxoglutarate aldolase/2-dehydro-3-deoxy-phosphogluconate aldolase [uncultured Ferrovibrio sp.]|jgi:2-dehydro-3-deoxyphosphogluconate aldolase/(4S)-4-hydroxy-2-oxoglutarate aldolase|uniref:bifunctional 4-hydroxy-2-oxoglutarate aldolase/2-dehydro-3-deoxy-phosphogluconate aldolase n=1 Tax=uncultured Ferrovibrio sp. TaxID=1576913 RepID=UPI00260FCC4B|nr:bifunctional 4-hydroxy-2-oxoglutarate aldolase/2-dehydro-3-deoxy-phosphogluconate aldolase [uncultured Ferrovibrio sp.]